MRTTFLLFASALAANAFIIDQVDSNKKCLEVGAVCKTNNGVVGPCCQNAHCPEPIVDLSRCTLNSVAAEDVDEDIFKKKCLKPGALCAGIAGPVGKCCKGSKCVYQSPDNAICEKTNKITIDITVEEDATAKCLQSGALCSGFAGPVGKCCEGLRCVNESPDRGICRGPKKAAIVVQDNSPFSEAKCLGPAATCSDFTGPKGTCCPPLKCTNVAADYAVCKGLKSTNQEESNTAGGACIKNGATCASTNGRYLPCCSGWECVRDNPYEPEHGACYKKK